MPDFFGVQFAPVAALMAAAAATTTLRIGTLVFDNDFRHPVVLAKNTATLDLLSDGRLELGIGAGWLRSEYAGAGLDYAPAGVRIDRLEEVAGLKGLFGEGPVRFSGCDPDRGIGGVSGTDSATGAADPHWGGKATDVETGREGR